MFYVHGGQSSNNLNCMSNLNDTIIIRKHIFIKKWMNVWMKDYPLTLFTYLTELQLNNSYVFKWNVNEELKHAACQKFSILTCSSFKNEPSSHFWNAIEQCSLLVPVHVLFNLLIIKKLHSDEIKDIECEASLVSSSCCFAHLNGHVLPKYNQTICFFLSLSYILSNLEYWIYIAGSIYLGLALFSSEWGPSESNTSLYIWMYLTQL